jgi:predicted phosphodiesterase
MRYAVFSDIHSNLQALEAVLAAYASEHIDAYLCIGDIVGYGADPNECIQRVAALPAVTVAGNHDQAALGIFSSQDFNPEAQEALRWTSERLSGSSRAFLASLPLVHATPDLVMVHGSLDAPESFRYLTAASGCAPTFERMERAVCFVGHTHVPVVFVREPDGAVRYQDAEVTTVMPDRRYIVNVGSVGQPRDSVPQATYCIYDTQRSTIEIRRRPYEVFTARRRIIEAGLPQFLGDRLLTGN